MTKVIIACGIVYIGFALAAMNWVVSLFLIPVFVGLIWVIYNAFVYSSQMEELAEQAIDEQEFTILEKDELQYVVVKGKG